MRHFRGLGTGTKMTTSTTLEDLMNTARGLYDRAEYEVALRILNGTAAQWRESAPASRLARDCYMKMGDVGHALGEVNRLRRRPHGPELDRQARFLLGRLRETDPAWLPATPPATQRPTPRPGVVLHLLKESLPYVESGFTLRSRMTLEAQRLAGFQPVVVTSLGFPRYKGVDEVPATETVGGITHHRLDIEADGNGVRVPYDILLDDQAAMTSAIADRERPSLVQAGSGFRGYDQALVGIAVAARSSLPFVYEVRGFLEATWTSDVQWGERGDYYHRRRAQEKRCLDAADRVITIADAMRDEIVARGVDEEKVTVVPNAVDVHRFAPRPKRPELAETLGLSQRPVIGYISNLGRREGVDLLIRATRALIDRGHDVACLIVGEGPERANLETLTEELGVSGSVVLTGHVPNQEIEDYYALIDIFVVPRLPDRAARFVTPLKPLEAMAMGIPLVTSDLPALRELASPGVRGSVFEPESPESLTDVISSLLDDAGHRKELSTAARKWVLAERTLESNVERYRQVFEAIL
jgi:glycosyltransferase involved in cell wall biosynthesis